MQLCGPSCVCVCVTPQVAESKFLNNRLVDVVNFIENIAVKDSTDKVRVMPTYMLNPGTGSMSWFLCDMQRPLHHAAYKP